MEPEAPFQILPEGARVQELRSDLHGPARVHEVADQLAGTVRGRDPPRQLRHLGHLEALSDEPALHLPHHLGLLGAQGRGRLGQCHPVPPRDELAAPGQDLQRLVEDGPGKHPGEEALQLAFRDPVPELVLLAVAAHRLYHVLQRLPPGGRGEKAAVPEADQLGLGVDRDGRGHGGGRGFRDRFRE